MRTAPAILVGLALPLAACGGSDSAVDTSADTTSSPGASIAAAAAETLDAPTARVTYMVEHTRSDATWGIEAGERGKTLEGVVDFGAYRIALAADQQKTIFDGPTVYFKDGYETDKRWKKYELDGTSTSEVSLIRRADPIHLLQLIASLDDFGPVPEVVGDEQVRGRATTHYEASVENESLMRAFVPGVSYEEYVQSQAYPEPIETYTPLEAWVGDDGRLHRVVYDFDVFGTLLGERTIVELYDFGADFEIELPAPSATVEG